MKDDDINKACDELGQHIEGLSKSVDWACGELARLRHQNELLSAENLELKLRNNNLMYYIRANVQARMN